MAKTFPFKIITPEKCFYSGEAEIVIARTLTGDEGYMAGHAWACKLLDTGELWFREAGAKEFRYAAISSGFIDVREDALIFTDTAEWPGEIDVSRAEKQQQLEQEWLDSHPIDKISPELALEIQVHKQSINRALNRKKVAGRKAEESGGGRQRH